MFYRLDIQNQIYFKLGAECKTCYWIAEVQDWISNSFNQLTKMSWDYKG